MKKKYKLVICLLTYLGAIAVLWNSSKLQKAVQNLNKTNLPAEDPITKDFVQVNAAHDDWSTLTPDIHLYSAYWDARDIHNVLVRLVAIGPRLKTENNSLQCAFKYREKVMYGAVKKQVLWENWNKKYSAVFYICVPPKNTPPEYVTLVTNSTVGMWKRVRGTKRRNSKANIAICVRPFFGPFNDTLKLAEFIAFYDITGVSRFTFYNFNSSEAIKNYFALLRNANLDVDLLPWNLSKGIDVWEQGQLAFTQDCIYRHMGAFEFVLVLDLDELIVPKGSKTLKGLATGAKANIGAFVFRNSFFCNANEGIQRNDLYLKSETWNKREELVWQASQRSKLLIRARSVVSSGIHAVHQFLKGFRRVVVNPAEFMLQHYRDAECNGKKKLVKDSSVLKFVDVMKSSRAMKCWIDNNRLE